MSERLIRLLRAHPPADGVADTELLARWADRRDEAAFELLLRRHAEPVWRTCRAVAGEGAEDAFQATFLALARRAGAVRGNVPGWLHQVARHASLRARRAGASWRAGSVSDRWTREVATSVHRSLTLPARHEAPAGQEADDFAPLHEELARLPAAYRVPILLCHLHGRTQAQAAAELGLPLGTVATRVRRGCDRLRVALTRRGLAPVVAFGPPLVLPASLIPATLGVGLGAVAAPPAIHSLAHGAVSAMSHSKLKALLAVVAVGAAVTGSALVARPPAADPPAKPEPQPAAKWEAKPADYFERKDGMERVKRLMLGVHVAYDVKDRVPADIVGKDGKPLLSWRVAILPYIDQELLYGLFKLDEPWDGPTNRPLLKHVPSTFRSAGAGPGMTRVKAFRGPNAAFDPAGNRKFADITDGMSNTIGVVDAGAAVEWTKPGDLDYAKDKPLPDLSGPFTDGFAAGYMDGSVRWHRAGLPEKFLRLEIERDDGMVIQEPDLPPLPKRPLSDREKKQAAVWLRQLGLARTRAEFSAAQRAAVTAALAKYGPVGPPELPPADDLWAIEQQLEVMQQLEAADSAAFSQLVERLRAKDPQAAEKMQQEHWRKQQELFEQWQKKK